MCVYRAAIPGRTLFPDPLSSGDSAGDARVTKLPAKCAKFARVSNFPVSTARVYDSTFQSLRLLHLPYHKIYTYMSCNTIGIISIVRAMCGTRFRDRQADQRGIECSQFNYRLNNSSATNANLLLGDTRGFVAANFRAGETTRPGYCKVSGNIGFLVRPAASRAQAEPQFMKHGVYACVSAVCMEDARACRGRPFRKIPRGHRVFPPFRSYSISRPQPRVARAGIRAQTRGRASAAINMRER